MVLMLNEDDSFSMSANVTSIGSQRTILKGYLVSTRPDGVYVAPIIPQLFYGASGAPLQTWRQDITQTGDQVIISRGAGGYPKVPIQDLYWRKVSDTKEAPKPRVYEPTVEVPSWVLPAGLLVAGGVIVYLLTRKW